MTKIAYLHSSGDVAIIISAGVLPLNEVARRDVEAGAPYIFIEDDDIPTDRSFRDAWEADFTNPDGYGIGVDAWTAEQEASE